MDARRRLIVSAAGLAVSGCATLAQLGLTSPSPAPATTLMAADPVGDFATAPIMPPVASPAQPEPAPALAAPETRTFASMSPIPNPGRRSVRPQRPLPTVRSEDPILSGPAAISAANTSARETSRARAFVGGVQVFTYDPGRVYEVWTAPLRVTTLTLSPGETIIAKAAGDTVRWQIGETQSGEGPTQRAHVMVKPLQRGLETNLVLATSQRVYQLQLRSGAPETFNAAITWDVGAVLGDARPVETAPAPGLVAPQGPLDAGFRIAAKGKPPAWTPSAVMTDGVHTFLTFPPGSGATETPALFAVSPDGKTQLVNYRQQGGLWVVDRVLDTAELRIGGRRPQVVRIERIGAAS